MSSINLLPWREGRKARQKRRFFTQLAIAAAMTLVVILLVNVRIGQLTALQQERNRFLQMEIIRLDQALGEISTIRYQRDQLLDRVRLIDQLQHRRTFSIRLFNQMPGLVPPGVYLSSLNVTRNRIELAGKTEAYPRVASMLRSMEASRWLTEPRLSSIYVTDAGPVELSQFSMSVNVAPEGEEP
ncbi:PilN domain-containing protein [Oceanimonas baumannii]|uniref:Fimbrial assembly protein n=1 Tax=Oceanimonas baumannii TaxID=129578 RepID=A0A235CLU5_9GAMM|nr:PilN domain-containing protein [Oceanimonas baumannii]OYD25409.1 fimbrial assembly protein [Oceanimonas baumannii]TDW61399.1 type IV pilus assembly protein PilN [Oceanimonas baumannii]